MLKSLHLKIEYLLSTHKLVVLRTQGLAWQEDFVKQLSVGRKLYNFVEPMLRHQATYRKEEFLREMKVPALLQDVQYVDGLFQNLLALDFPKGSLLIVVKQSCYIMEETCNDDLAVFDLPIMLLDERIPFELQNIAMLKNRSVSENVFDKILNGYLGRECCSDFIKRFLQYDLKDFTVASDDLKFYRFMCAVAASSGNIVNYAQLGKLVDVSSPTAKQWLKYLEGAGLVYLLPPLEHAGSQRLTKAPKLYFRDTGLACHLLNINCREDLLNSNLLNAFFETWVVMQIREASLQNGAEAKLLYYRDSNAKEISLLMQCGTELHPVEIKRDLLNVKRVQKKFRVFGELLSSSNLEISTGCVICDCDEVIALADNLWQVPAKIL